MRSLGKTTADLARYKRRWEEMVAMTAEVQGLSQAGSASSRLVEVEAFGPNPGNLRMLTYVPADLPPGAGLVVVLHGCQQNAAGYDHGAGWSVLADRFGFAVLFPEQQGANNPNVCFNWFVPGDTARGRGEALSIREMTEAMVVRHGLDRKRVFVTGLSAGGAMASVMLATYPDVYAGGAIIAGLPFGGASNVQEALDAMFQGRGRPGSEWGDLVRRASPHKGPWPKVSVWHGSADTTVKSANADEIVKQWTDVHAIRSWPEEDRVDGFPRRVWRANDGSVVVESYTITGMAHGTPLATGAGEGSVGTAGPFLLDVGISSSYRIAEFWGLIEGAGRSTGTRVEATGTRPEATGIRAEAGDTRTEVAETPVGASPVLEGEVLTREDVPRADPKAPGQSAPHKEAQSRSLDIGATITKALRAAGLIKD